MFADIVRSPTFIINFLFLIYICDSTDEFKENVTVYLKSWPYQMVKKECESLFLNNYGFTSVLVSSVQNNVQSGKFDFRNLFAFQTKFGSEDDFKSMIRSCLERGIRTYVSIKLITKKQIEIVIRKYEEMEPFFLEKKNNPNPASKQLASKTNTNTNTKTKTNTTNQLPQKTPTNPPTKTAQPKKPPNKPKKADNEKERLLKNTRYLIGITFLTAIKNYKNGSTVLIQSFKLINKRYIQNIRRKEILSERANFSKVLQKYCKLKYKLENLSPAIDFIKKLINLGASGIRVENAGYISPIALKTIFQRVQTESGKKVDVIFDDLHNVKSYAKIGDVMEEDYAINLMSAVNDVNFNRLINRQKKIWPDGWTVARSDRSRPFVPKYIIPEDKRYKDEWQNFKIATGLMLANPYGRPIIVSPYGGLKKKLTSLPSMTKVSITMEKLCEEGKYCIHRKKVIRELVMFRLVTKGQKITSYGTLSNNIMYINRGEKGIAVFAHRKARNSDKELDGKESIQTELPPGLYCNIIAGYTNVKRDVCQYQSVIEVDLNRKVHINMKEAKWKHVVAIDIMSRLQALEINPDGKLILHSKLFTDRDMVKSNLHVGRIVPRSIDDMENSLPSERSNNKITALTTMNEYPKKCYL